MQNKKEFKTLVLKAPTGSGKTYELIKNGLYLTFTFKKTSIISTKNKKLVDQIYEDCINLYKNETINGEKISKKKNNHCKTYKGRPFIKRTFVGFIC